MIEDRYIFQVLIVSFLLLTVVSYFVSATAFQPIIVSLNESFQNVSIYIYNHTNDIIAQEEFLGSGNYTSNIYYLTNITGVFYYDEVYNASWKANGVWVDSDNNTPTYIGRSNTFKNYIQIEDNQSLITPPKRGTFEFYNDRMYLTNVGTQRAIDRTSDVLLETTTVADTTTETTIYTGTIGANDFKAGNIIKIKTNGIMSTFNAAQTLTLRVKIGSTTISANTQTGSTLSNEPWDSEVMLTIRSVGASGSVAAHTDLDIGGLGVSSSTSQTSTLQTIDTTIAEDITVTAQWSSANAANTLSIYQGIMEFKN